MMPPNLRSVVAQSLQGRRSIGSRRNFSSSRDSNGGMDFAPLKEIALGVFERVVLVAVGYVLADMKYEKKRSRARLKELEEMFKEKQNQEAFQQKDDLVSV